MRIRSEHCAISKPIETDSVHMVLEDNAFRHQFVPNLFFCNLQFRNHFLPG